SRPPRTRGEGRERELRHRAGAPEQRVRRPAAHHRAAGRERARHRAPRVPGTARRPADPARRARQRRGALADPSGQPRRRCSRLTRQGARAVRLPGRGRASRARAGLHARVPGPRSGRARPPDRGGAMRVTMAEQAKTPEEGRLEEDARRERNWKRWGPYLAERQWGTVREDYSPDGTSWDYLPHDHARSRAYRWGEDGLLGITDREGRLCFALALWNERDPILKERLFGLTGPEGNHGEDVKECYFYLDATPTHSYLKALYKYPQRAYPYTWLVEENRRRGKNDAEFELVDTGVFDDGRYFDVTAEYAKASPEDILVRLTIANRGPDAAPLHVLPTLWFRNTWSWGRTGEGYWPKPRLARAGDGTIVAEHASLGRYRLVAEGAPELLFTENETNVARLFGAPNPSPWVKDAFHDYVVHGRADAVNPEGVGTKAACHYRLEIPAGGAVTLQLRLTADAEAAGPDPSRVFTDRIREADAFYARHIPGTLGEGEQAVVRQAYASLLWSKKFYHYVVKDWLEGDPAQPPPPPSRRDGRNHDWPHLYNRDVISMPEGWEYPWYPACARLVGVARLQDDRAARRARPALPLPPLPEALPQLHLVGEPQGQRGEPPLRRRLPRPRQHRRVRPLPPAARGRHARAGRRHRVDGLLLRDPARDGARARPRGPRLRGHGLQVLRALRRHRRRHERVRRQRALVPRRRLLLRPATDERARRPAARALDGGADPAPRVHGARRGGARALPRVREAHALVPRQPARPRAPHRVGRDRPRAPAPGDPVARAARAGAPLHAGRERAPLPARHPLALAGAPRAPVRAHGGRA